MNDILFYSEVADYQFNNIKKTRNWLNYVASSEDKSISKLEYFFVDDIRILEINTKHLNHTYKTDIITFDYSFLKEISGEVFICLSEVKNNSDIYSEGDFENELMRIILHGLLHLCGYMDGSDVEIFLMRKLENVYLNYLDQF